MDDWKPKPIFKREKSGKFSIGLWPNKKGLPCFDGSVALTPEFIQASPFYVSVWRETDKKHPNAPDVTIVFTPINGKEKAAPQQRGGFDFGSPQGDSPF